MPRSKENKAGLRSKTQRSRKPYKTMRDVADSFEIPEDELITMVQTAFIEMVDADRYLVLPLQLQQAARLIWSENRSRCRQVG